jgi:predicted negative regulator of RcsB-dependent stress response
VAAHWVEDGELEKAREQLQWATEHAQQPELANLSRLRLARVLWASGEGDAALKQLEMVEQPFRSLADEIRGDIYRALGDEERARSAYQAAQGALSLAGASDAWLQMKLDDLARRGMDAPSGGDSKQ